MTKGKKEPKEKEVKSEKVETTSEAVEETKTEKSAKPKSEPKKEVKAKKPEGIWSCNLYIRGYGHVKEGEDVTAEAVALLKEPAKYVE